MSTNNITLLIGTCDKYSFLWENFKTLQTKYIDLPDSPKVVFTESLDFGEGYTMSHLQNPHWSNLLKDALDKVTTEFVFFVLEDYFFVKKITSDDFSQITEAMDKHSLSKFMFVAPDGMTHLTAAPMRPITNLSMPGNHFLQHIGSQYLTSVQPSVWRTDYLRECVKKDWNPWQFEIEGSKERAGHMQSTALYFTDIIFFNVVKQGFTANPGWEEVKEKENLQPLVFPKT